MTQLLLPFPTPVRPPHSALDGETLPETAAASLSNPGEASTSARDGFVPAYIGAKLTDPLGLPEVATREWFQGLRPKAEQKWQWGKPVDHVGLSLIGSGLTAGLWYSFFMYAGGRALSPAELQIAMYLPGLTLLPFTNVLLNDLILTRYIYGFVKPALAWVANKTGFTANILTTWRYSQSLPDYIFDNLLFEMEGLETRLDDALTKESWNELRRKTRFEGLDEDEVPIYSDLCTAVQNIARNPPQETDLPNLSWLLYAPYYTFAAAVFGTSALMYTQQEPFHSDVAKAIFTQAITLNLMWAPVTAPLQYVSFELYKLVYQTHIVPMQALVNKLFNKSVFPFADGVLAKPENHRFDDMFKKREHKINQKRLQLSQAFEDLEDSPELDDVDQMLMREWQKILEDEKVLKARIVAEFARVGIRII